MVSFTLALLLATLSPESSVVDLIEVLGSEDYRRREEAFKEILRMGEKASLPLRSALKNDDPEIRRQARLLLELIKWNLRPDHPPEIAVLLHRFSELPSAERERIANDIAFIAKEKAIPILHRIFKEDPERSVRISAARGMALYPEGLEILRQEGVPAVGLSLYDVAVLISLGNSYLERSQYSKALEQYRRVLDLEPKNPTAYYNIACVYSRQKKSKEALEALKQALEYGFDDFDWMEKDPDLDNIRDLPEFLNLVDLYKK